MQVAVRIILAIALAWQPVLGLAAGACAAAAPLLKACSIGASCCCGGGSCPMSAPAIGCNCGGDQPAPGAPSSNDKRSDRCDRVLGLAPVLCAVAAPTVVVLARLNAGDTAAPRGDGPSFQAVLCVWLT